MKKKGVFIPIKEKTPKSKQAKDKSVKQYYQVKDEDCFINSDKNSDLFQK